MSGKTVSIVKESREGDRRVIALPEQVAGFVKHQYQVYVEHDAGLGQGFADDDYRAAGATVLGTEDAWTASDVVFKCRCPSEAEYRFFRPGLHLGATFYLGDRQALAERLKSDRVSAYSYEMFEDDDGKFPLMVTDSEISGHMAVVYAAYHLQEQLGGSGKMLIRMPGVEPTRVLVIGHGNSGGAAARTAAALGAQVTVVGRSPAHLRRFAATMPPNVTCEINTPALLEDLVPRSDVIIGAILVSNYGTPPMVTEDLVARMRPGSVIVDITIGYGPGYIPTSDHVTRKLTDAFKRHDVTHITNDCMPKEVYRTATAAMSRAAFPYLLALAESVHGDQPDPVSRRGQVTGDGEVVHPHIRSELAFREQALG